MFPFLNGQVLKIKANAYKNRFILVYLSKVVMKCHRTCHYGKIGFSRGNNHDVSTKVDPFSLIFILQWLYGCIMTVKDKVVDTKHEKRNAHAGVNEDRICQCQCRFS